MENTLAVLQGHFQRGRIANIALGPFEREVIDSGGATLRTNQQAQAIATRVEHPSDLRADETVSARQKDAGTQGVTWVPSAWR